MMSQVQPQPRNWKYRALENLMSEISEDCWCAGWMEGLEYRLWELVDGDTDPRYGMGEVDPLDVVDLKAISTEIGGWIRWHGYAVFIPMDQWLEEFRKWKSRRATDREQSAHDDTPDVPY